MQNFKFIGLIVLFQILLYFIFKKKFLRSIIKLKLIDKPGKNKIHKSRNQLKAAANEAWVKTKIPKIKEMMEHEKDTNSISANKVVEVLILDELDYGNEEVADNTIKTRVRRKLFNGLRGKEVDPKKGGMTAMGVEYEDGYNFWLEANPKAVTGNAKWFIRRGKDFKRS